MGFSVSWHAVRGKPIECVLGQLKLQRTGRFEVVPESPYSAISLDAGWLVIFANDFRFIESAPLAALSESSELITCAVEEHVMSSSASSLKNGRPVWAIAHDSQLGLGHLEVNGEVPREFAAIKARLTDELSEAGGDESEIDYLFDVPLELAKALTGFCHDRYLGDEPKFEKLEQIVPRWKFSSETRAVIPLPPEATFVSAFDHLDPKNNSFFILEYENGNYMQCGGGKKACTVEFRVHESANAYKHYVVGRAREASDPGSIQMSGGMVELPANEVLNDREAIELFELFFAGKEVPKKYVLREKNL